MRHAIVLVPVPLFILAGGCNSPTGPELTTTTAQATQTHMLTMTASPSCAALPDVAKKRTYPAQIQQGSNGALSVWVVNSTDIMVGWANEDGFTGTRDGNTVRFEITDDIQAGVAMIERIPGVGDMGYAGTATGTIDTNGRILATFDGEYRLGYGSGPVLCHASDHQIEVTPL